MLNVHCVTDSLAEGDRAIVYGKNPLLTKPLKEGGKTDVRRGVLQHDQIIGKTVRDMVQAYKGLCVCLFLVFDKLIFIGPEYRLGQPTLDEYVTMTPRLVTPVCSEAEKD